MKTPGFSILEIMMVMAISAVIMTCVLEIYNQTAKNMGRVQRFVFEDTQILTLKNRLGKDFSGLSSIWFKQADVEKIKAIMEKKAVYKEKRACSYFFYSKLKDDHFDILTFLTTSGLQSYGKAQDRFVRVVYKLEPDPLQQGLFRLMRKEITPASEYIDEKGLESGRFYELIAGIKSFDITYELIDRVALKKNQEKNKKSKDGAQDKDEQQETVSYLKTVRQWLAPESKEKTDTTQVAEKTESSDDKNTDDKADDKNDTKKDDLGGAPVPKFVHVTIVFGQTLTQQEREYKLDFTIPSTVDTMPKSILSQKPIPKPTHAV